MRTWIALWFCLLAGTAGAQTSDTSQVPPLAAGETAPAEPPNYFDARELGAATTRRAGSLPGDDRARCCCRAGLMMAIGAG